MDNFNELRVELPDGVEEIFRNESDENRQITHEFGASPDGTLAVVRVTTHRHITIDDATGETSVSNGRRIERLVGDFKPGQWVRHWTV